MINATHRSRSVEVVAVPRFDSWLVTHTDGRVELLNDSEFAARYEAISAEDNVCSVCGKPRQECFAILNAVGEPVVAEAEK